MIKPKELPSADHLKSIFEYRDGKLYHIKAGSGVTVGTIAGNYNQPYVAVKIKQSAYRLHRVIFMMHHDYCPETIDHINGNKHDNRIENLRAATHVENKRNKALDSTNKSGVKGVFWAKHAKRWIAQIYVNGKKRHLGCFVDLNLAQEFMELAREMVHGKFANHGQFTA